MGDEIKKGKNFNDKKTSMTVNNICA